jgi:hypothetical protein
MCVSDGTAAIHAGTHHGHSATVIAANTSDPTSASRDGICREHREAESTALQRAGIRETASLLRRSTRVTTAPSGQATIIGNDANTHSCGLARRTARQRPRQQCRAASDEERIGKPAAAQRQTASPRPPPLLDRRAAIDARTCVPARSARKDSVRARGCAPRPTVA